jgi:hypothetical protein
VTGQAIYLFARFVTAPRAIWQGIEPVRISASISPTTTSNGDFVLIWTALPAPLRRQTRPVAALDYWLSSPLRTFIGREVFNAVLIDRRPEARAEDPVAQMVAALDQGSSLILFPKASATAPTRRFFRSSPDFTTLPSPARVRPCSGLDRQPQPCDAQGRSHSRAADLHPDLRRPASFGRGRAEGRLPCPRHPLLALLPGRGRHDLPHLLWLLAGVGTILVLASIIGEILRARLSPARRKPGDREPECPDQCLVGDGGLLALAFIAGKPGSSCCSHSAPSPRCASFSPSPRTTAPITWSLVACFFVILPLQYWFLASTGTACIRSSCRSMPSCCSPSSRPCAAPPRIS